MKVRDGFVLKQIAENTVVVPAGNDLVSIDSLLMLNSTGCFLWNLLQTDSTIEFLANSLVSEYNIDFSTARADATEFVNVLKESNILE